MAFLELPQLPPDDDPGVYIGLLMGAIDDWLKMPSNWSPSDYESAYNRMEQLKDWLARVVDMSSTVVGSIAFFAFNNLPDGWMLCEGQSLLREEYPALLNAIGLTFGFVDNDHFNIPNLRRKFPIGTWPTFLDLGDTGGEMDVSLTAAQNGQHSHSVRRSGGGAGSQPAAGTGSVASSIVTESSGSGEPHNNMPPYLALNAAIFAGT